MEPAFAGKTSCGPPGRPHVLLLTDHFFGAHGGTEQHILFLLRSLPRLLLQTSIALVSDDPRHRLESLPIEPMNLSSGCRAGIRGCLKRLYRLQALIRRLRVDVVHAFDQTSEAYALIAVRLARRGRVLASRRNVGYWHTRRTLLGARVLRLFGAAYVANCAAARDFAVANEWIAPHRVEVIPNPAQVERLQRAIPGIPPAHALGICAGERVVAMVATVRPIKDYATFLGAARIALDRRPNTRFLSVGAQQPQYLRDLQSMATSLGISGQIGWLGRADNPFTVLAHCDVGVLSSLSEGFPNAALEYAVAAVPTVATDVGGTREVVTDGVTGFLVPPRSPEAMADRICRLLDDDELRHAFGKRARVRATSLFSEEKVLAQYVSLYRSLAGRVAAPTDRAKLKPAEMAAMEP